MTLETPRLRRSRSTARFVALGLGALLMIAPFLYMAATSFKPNALAFEWPPRFIPDPAIRSRNGDQARIVPFKVCGATCDSVDILSRPFWLPETIDTGDWVEIGHIGAYSMALRTRFNGFFADRIVALA